MDGEQEISNGSDDVWPNTAAGTSAGLISGAGSILLSQSRIIENLSAPIIAEMRGGDDDPNKLSAKPGMFARDMKSGERSGNMWPQMLNQRRSTRRTIRFSGLDEKESLLDGFVLLRLAQLINFDIHYIETGGGHKHQPAINKQELKKRRAEKDDVVQPPTDSDIEQGLRELEARHKQMRRITNEPSDCRPNLIDELADMNPIWRYICKYRALAGLCRLFKIALSLTAIMISIDKTISTILLCLLSKHDIDKAKLDVEGSTYEASDVTMSWLVLVLVNICSTYIIISTIFSGHLVWELLAQRMFFVSRRFQYKAMLSLIAFVYFEYVLNISMINNLFGWSFEAETDQLGGPSSSNQQQDSSTANSQASFDAYSIHNSYSILSKIEIFVTDKDERNWFVDILLTIFQFARGIVRVSPYITVNFVIICLTEHVKAIRNQVLLTDSFKKRQKLRMVVKSRRDKLIKSRPIVGLAIAAAAQPGRSSLSPASMISTQQQQPGAKKKRVIFKTEESANFLAPGSRQIPDIEPNTDLRLQSASPISLASSSFRSISPNGHTAGSERTLGAISPILLNSVNHSRPSGTHEMEDREEIVAKSRRRDRQSFLECIKDFGELDAAVTNMYIFTGRLNRIMSRQGLAVFFIVHNLIITCTLIVPQAISGGPVMASLIRFLVVAIAMVPFISGHSLVNELDELSKQIDRVIIYQQFTGQKRDNLVRIRDLLEDIRVNCGGMLEFKMETGIKYLVIAFACAFFIEQEHYKLTRRH